MSVKNPVIYVAGSSSALKHTCEFLAESGCTVTESPDQHVSHLLLPVPAFESEGILKGGIQLDDVLNALPKSITVLGGNLDSPRLESYRSIDLLKDETYLSENALITAHCALKLAAGKLAGILKDLPVLIVGWGRIGKHLAKLLLGLGSNVTVAARKESDRGMLKSLGYTTIHPRDIGQGSAYQLVFNTVPLPMMKAIPGSVSIDLASVRGIAGEKVIWARGLPGKDAPEASGRLIAETVLRRILEQEEMQ